MKVFKLENRNLRLQRVVIEEWKQLVDKIFSRVVLAGAVLFMMFVTGFFILRSW